MAAYAEMMANRPVKKSSRKGPGSGASDLLRKAKELEAKGDVDGEIKAYKSFLSRNRSHPKADQIRTRAAQLMVMLGRHDQAIDLISMGGIGAQKDLQLMFTLAQAHAYSGNMEGSLEALGRALEINPDFAPAIARCATVYMYTGKRDEAQAIIEAAIDRGVDGWDIDHALGEIAPRSGRIDEAIERITKRLGDQTLKTTARVELEIKLAEMLEIRGDYKGAYEAAERANKQKGVSGLGGYVLKGAKAHNPKVMVDRYKERIGQLMALFSPETLRSLEPDDKGPERREEMIFISGMPRSGTTLLEQILSSHSEAETAGEAQALIWEATRLKFYPSPDESRIGQLSANKRTKSGLKVLEDLRHIAGADVPYVVDKHPGNDEHVGLLSAIAPGCKIIITRRDPRDIALSCFFRNFAVGHEWTTRFDTIVDMLETRLRMHDYWMSVIPEHAPWVPITIGEYETIVANPESEAKRLVAHAGLGWEDSCLEFSKRKRIVPTLNPHQAAQGVYTGSVKKWHKYAEVMDPKQLDRLHEIAERHGFDS